MLVPSPPVPRPQGVEYQRLDLSHVSPLDVEDGEPTNFCPDVPLPQVVAYPRFRVLLPFPVIPQ